MNPIPFITANLVACELGYGMKGGWAQGDAGWWGAQGYPAERAPLELKGHLFAVHLEDVWEAGAHRTCRYGEGAVDIPACVRAPRQAGYTGPLGVEPEPEEGDPAEDVKAGKALLEGWLGAAA